MRDVVQLCLLAMLSFSNLHAQTTFHSPNTPSMQTFTKTSGTLNLVLANRNGFVIAADSRGTETQGGVLVSRKDIYQKLFKAGRKTAVAIAGLLATPPEPFSFEVISRLRRRYGDSGLVDGRGEPRMASDWLAEDLNSQLDVLSAVLSVSGSQASDLRLIATVAGYDSNGEFRLSQIHFGVDSTALNTNGKLVRHLGEPRIRNFTEEGFLYSVSGMPSVAEDILEGRRNQGDPVVSVYLSAKERNALDELSLGDLERLARVIFRETIAVEQGVGGDVQIAVVPRRGEPQWHLKLNSVPLPVLGGTELFVGGIASPENIKTWRSTLASYSMSQNFDALTVKSVFVAMRFEDLTIDVGESAYFGSSFKNCTFRVTKKPAVRFGESNAVDKCKLVIDPKVAKTLTNELLWLQQRCEPVSGEP